LSPPEALPKLRADSWRQLSGLFSSKDWRADSWRQQSSKDEKDEKDAEVPIEMVDSTRIMSLVVSSSMTVQVLSSSCAEQS
jgi:hypothetical protein